MNSLVDNFYKFSSGTPYSFRKHVFNLLFDYVSKELQVTQWKLGTQLVSEIDDNDFYEYLIRTGQITQLENIIQSYELDPLSEISNLQKPLEQAQVKRLKNNNLTNNTDVKSLLIYRNLLYNQLDRPSELGQETINNLFTPITKDNITERYVQRLISDSKKKLASEYSFKSYVLGFLDAVWENLERNGEVAGIEVEPSAINDCAEDYLEFRDVVLKGLGAQIISKKSHRIGYQWGRFNARFNLKLNKPFFVY
jgi:hypothetical protein